MSIDKKDSKGAIARPYQGVVVTELGAFPAVTAVPAVRAPVVGLIVNTETLLLSGRWSEGIRGHQELNG